MKPEFHEDYLNAKASPVSEPCTDFDWQSVYEALGEVREDLDERDYGTLAAALQEVLKWLVRGDLKHPNFDRMIGRRAIGLTWVLCPSYFAGSPSLTKIALSLGITPAALSAHSTSATKAFGVTNKPQVHGWNRNR